MRNQCLQAAPQKIIATVRLRNRTNSASEWSRFARAPADSRISLTRQGGTRYPPRFTQFAPRPCNGPKVVSFDYRSMLVW